MPLLRSGRCRQAPRRLAVSSQLPWLLPFPGPESSARHCTGTRKSQPQPVVTTAAIIGIGGSFLVFLRSCCFPVASRMLCVDLTQAQENFLTWRTPGCELTWQLDAAFAEAASTGDRPLVAASRRDLPARCPRWSRCHQASLHQTSHAHDFGRWKLRAFLSYLALMQGLCRRRHGPRFLLAHLLHLS